MTVARYLPDQPNADDLDLAPSRDEDVVSGGANDLVGTPTPTAKRVLGSHTEQPPMGSDATAFASLTHEKPLVIGAQDDGSETVTKYDGASWVVTRKDLHSGLITRFTQTGDSAVGTIEIMQGKSVSASWSPSAFDHPQGPPNPDPKAFYSWQGSEDKGPVLKTLKAQPLPKEMRGEFSAMHIAAPWIDPRAYEGIYPGSARREVIQENRDMAARLNAEEAAHKPAKTVGPHQSRPQGVPVSPH